MGAAAVALWQPEAAWAFAPFSACAALILIFDLVFTRHKKTSKSSPDPYSTPLDPWIAAYLASFFVTLVMNTARGLYAQEIFMSVSFVAVYYAAARFRATFKLIKSLFIGMLVVGVVIGLLALADSKSEPASGTVRAAAGMVDFRWNFASHVLLSGFLSVALGMGLGALMVIRNRWLKFAAVACITVLFIIFLMAQSRAGWIALGITVALALALAPVSGRKKTGIFAAMLAVVIVAVIVMRDQLAVRLQESIDRAITDEARFYVWRATAGMIRENWLTGIGPGMFQYDIQSYRVPGYNNSPTHAFNHWLTVFSEQGIFVLPALAALTFMLVRRATQCLRTLTTDGDRLRAGAAFSLVAVGLHDLFSRNLGVWFTGALVCALAGWIQPPSEMPRREPGPVIIFMRRCLIAGVAVACLVLSYLYGYSDRLLWKSELKNNAVKSVSLTERIRTVHAALKILPSNAAALKRRAVILTGWAGQRSNVEEARKRWIRAAGAWKRYLALNSHDLESNYYLAIAVTGQNDGVLTGEALNYLDVSIRRKNHQRRPRMAAAKYVLDHLAPGDEAGRRWAEERILEVARRFTDWDSEWRAFDLLYAYWRRQTSQVEAVEKMEEFFDRYGMSREDFYRFLRTSNLWSHYARYDLADAGLNLAKPASEQTTARLLSGGPVNKYEPVGSRWEEAGGGTMRMIYRARESAGVGEIPSHLILHASSSLCGGDGSYIKVLAEKKVLGGLMANDPAGRDYILDLPGPLSQDAQIELILVNAKRRFTNECDLTCRVSAVVWVAGG